MRIKFSAFIFAIMLFFSLKSYALNVISDIPPHPTDALIVMHGLGGNGKTMSSLGRHFSKAYPNMAIYYPTAPDKFAHRGYQWFEIPTLGDKMTKEDAYQIMMTSAIKNLKELHQLIEEIHTTQNIPYKNIHISGFSQGGFMAILASLTNHQKIGKVISFSGVPVKFTKDFTKSSIKSSPKILIIEGTSDNIIPKESYKITSQTLSSLNIPYNIKIIPNMPHTINQEAINSAISFLKTNP